MKYLFVLNDPPYGTERTFNGIRWARQMLESDPGNEVRVFNFADAVISVSAGQKVPTGYYNLAKMTSALVEKGGVIGNCSACMDARGLSDDRLIDGVHRSSMAELAQWTAWADQVITL
ncbi:DsrE/DsrF/TusD sulfur relay family protein [Rhodococcus xishaensis]|uniref:DsrE/DsrF/TusD sulfur relay family protein n=1 Tax=Rhodococcus xishaensis TaxID=2487364 RepID=UPI0022A88529|nr:DsrE family protein [Rhodococcus xishaensis]